MDANSEFEIDDVSNGCNYYYGNEFDQIRSQGKITGKPYDGFISVVSDTKSDKSKKNEY